MARWTVLQQRVQINPETGTLAPWLASATYGR
jgi:hypothetical protein